MPSGVACVVNSCKYWEENNKCTAEFIHIKTDYASILRQIREDSEFASEVGDKLNEVRHSIDTCCHTYEPKGDEHE